jgi:hypothetical protein
MSPKAPILLRVDAEVRYLVQIAARKQNRSMNNYIETLILKDQGLPASDQKANQVAETMDFNREGPVGAA